MGLRFFLDFDGTITQSDVVDSVLERFASSEWRKVEKEWVDGKIGSRECLKKQIGFVSTTPDRLDALLSEVSLDPYFISFLKRARDLNIPVAVLSDGFDLIIRNVLERSLVDFPQLLKDLPIYSNALQWTPRGLKVVFAGKDCDHGCANCKESLIQKLTQDSEKVVFVGDGLSDRYAAKIADLTFAKRKLLDFCRENRIHHRQYSNFRQIQDWLEEASHTQYTRVLS